MPIYTPGKLILAKESVHPEAADWATRATAADATTVTAVSNFCKAIDNESGLRAAITRLNLFCGDNLSAALVPLYLAESFGVAAKGNTTDTNNNFVTGDYNATGTTGGLRKASNTNAYLNTGLAPSQFGTTLSQHLSVSAKNCATTNVSDFMFLGAYNGEVSLNSTIVALDEVSAYLSGTNDRAFRHGLTDMNRIVGTSLQSTESHLLGSRTSGSSSILYRSGSQVAQNIGTNPTPQANVRPIFVFALNSAGSPGGYSSATIRMYSIGSGITASQAAAFSTAVSNFNTALGRT